MQKYNKAFQKEYKKFLSKGMTEEQIEAFYPVWLEQYRSDDRFVKHVRLFGNETENGCYAFRWGAQRKEKGASEETDDWSVIKLSIHSFEAKTKEPQFDESVLDEIGDDDLNDQLRQFSPTIQQTIEKLSLGRKKQDIARSDHVSCAAITHRIEKFKGLFEEYGRKYHLLKT